MSEQRTIFWIGWARDVGSSDFREVVHIYIDDPEIGWRWLHTNWTEPQRQKVTLCVTRCGEHPYGNRYE